MGSSFLLYIVLVESYVFKGEIICSKWRTMTQYKRHRNSFEEEFK